MLFLLNDVILNLAPRSLTPPMPAGRFAALGLTHIMQLGRELFARDPRLQAQAAGRAQKLAVLLVMKAPQVNAARFVAPEQSCDPDAVDVRLATLDLGLMALLRERQDAGCLTGEHVDLQVWTRKAA